MWHSTKRCSSIFDLSPLTPKNFLSKIWQKIAYKSACMADRPEMFGPTGGLSGMADSMENVVEPTLVAMATKFWQIWDIFAQNCL